MATLREKYQSITERLYEQTSSGALSWVLSYENDLQCELGRHIIKLKSFRDEEGEPIEQIEFFNSDDLRVDYFNDVTLAGIVPTNSEFATYFSMMQSLREKARRNALGADKALDEILSALDDDIPF